MQRFESGDESGESVLQSSSYEEVLRETSRLSQDERTDGVHWCRQFTEERLLQEESLRVPVVRVSVSLLPDSFALIEGWLSNPRLYEMHFTLFCYLDWVAYWPTLGECKPRTLRLIEIFLLKVKRNSGLAAWMAGDLLGDHWPPDESVIVLVNVLGNATYVAGRKAALSGLEMLFSVSDRELTAQNRALVLKALRKAGRGDRSAPLKKDAGDLARNLTATHKKVNLVPLSPVASQNAPPVSSSTVFFPYVPEV